MISPFHQVPQESKFKHDLALGVAKERLGNGANVGEDERGGHLKTCLGSKGTRRLAIELAVAKGTSERERDITDRGANAEPYC